jgi:hypothetical protein
VAAKMLQKDPALKAEFEQRIASDSTFARSPRARLNWLYLRSPWADSQLNVYPVGRVFDRLEIRTVQ